MSELEKFILKTLTWFDIFDYPLKPEEIHKYLFTNDHSRNKFGTSSELGSGSNQTRSRIKSGMANKNGPVPMNIGIQSDEIGINEISKNINVLIEQKLINEKSGYYFLHHKESNIKTRQQRAVIFDGKIKRAKKIARKLSYIPWIKAITVCNTLGYHNAPAASDIDLFIITNKDRIWITRFFVLSTLKFLRARPQLSRFGSPAEKRKDKIDANFFISEASLDIKSLALKDDIYLNFWIIQQIPLYDIDNTYTKFIAANVWLKKSLPNLTNYEPDYCHQLKNTSHWYTKLVNSLITNSLINLLELLARWLQLKILPQKLKAMANQSSGVIINNSMLKFHDQDRRAYFRDLWLEKIQNLKLS